MTKAFIPTAGEALRAQADKAVFYEQPIYLWHGYDGTMSYWAISLDNKPPELPNVSLAGVKTPAEAEFWLDCNGWFPSNAA